jgi:hypothetical protein
MMYQNNCTYDTVAVLFSTSGLAHHTMTSSLLVIVPPFVCAEGRPYDNYSLLSHN